MKELSSRASTGQRLLPGGAAPRKGYEVHGLIRRSSTFNTTASTISSRTVHDPAAHLFLYYGDLSVSGQLTDLLHDIKPDESYHLGPRATSGVSFDMPEYAGVTGMGTPATARGHPQRVSGHASTRPRRAKCSVRPRRPQSEKTLCFIPAAPTPRQGFVV